MDATDVRPFWGRAAALTFAGALAVYVCVVLAAFALLRGRGYDLAFSSVAWPPEWRRFHESQARLFFQRGREAYAAGRINEAVLSLAYAFERDPRNYEAGGLLAWLWQASQPTLANRIYFQLIRDHPARRTETAQRWYRALLNRGDFETIAQLATEMLEIDSQQTSAWTYALLFASRQRSDTAFLDTALTRATPLSPEIQAVLTLEKQTRTQSNALARESLLAGAFQPGMSAFSIHHRLDCLIRLGHGADVLKTLPLATSLDERSRTTLRLDAWAGTGDLEARQKAIATLLSPAPTLAGIELLCAHLIRCPQLDLTRQLFAKLDETPLTQKAENYTGYTALFCLAALSCDGPRSRAYSDVLRQVSGASLAFLPGVEAYFRGETEDQRMSTYLPRMQPLPLEVVCALYERPPPSSRPELLLRK